uniref:Uncharacterized protein n=1 Tax=viral metagenome TaxID=1070528 RepID=A0A6C0E9T2_9ZZZZ
MSELSDYIDVIMHNHSETEIQRGGNNSSVPNGGFPPIFLCDNKEQEKQPDIKIREVAIKKDNIVSIKDIMKTRRDTTPLNKF